MNSEVMSREKYDSMANHQHTHTERQKTTEARWGFLHVGLSRQTDRPLLALPGDSSLGWDAPTKTFAHNT